MGQFEQKRLDLLFEMESIKTYFMNFVSPGVNIKIVTELGYKDKNGNKRRFYEETRYKSNKYNNLDTLTSACFRINTYIVWEYPNQAFQDGTSNMKNNGIIIRPYAIDDLVRKMRAFTKDLYNCYKVINGKLTLLSDRAHDIEARPTPQTSIIFSHNIYKSNTDNSETIGVRITLNNEYSFIVNAETTWSEMLYRFSRCDLTSLGIQMIQSYMALLPGMAVTDIGGNYNGTRSFRPYWNEDPDETINSPDAVGVRGKPVTKEGKINSFFDDL